MKHIIIVVVWLRLADEKHHKLCLDVTHYFDLEIERQGEQSESVIRL